MKEKGKYFNEMQMWMMPSQNKKISRVIQKAKRCQSVSFDNVSVEYV